MEIILGSKEDKNTLQPKAKLPLNNLFSIDKL